MGIVMEKHKDVLMRKAVKTVSTYKAVCNGTFLVANTSAHY